MMRIFKKNKSVPQLRKIEEFSENRQDMECNPKPTRDLFQPVHQNPTPKDKRRRFLPRVGKALRRLFCCGKKKKIHRDPEEINWIPSAITEDNETISEKKTEATSSTDSAHQQTAEKLEFAPTAEAAAASIDEIQLSIPTETVAISESGTKITSTTDNEYDQKIQIQSTNAKDIVETVPSLADGTEPKTTTDRDPSSDSTYEGELKVFTAVETVAELKDCIEISIPTETVITPDSVIEIPSSTSKSDSEDTPQSTDLPDIVETTTERDPSSDTTHVSTDELEFFTAVETMSELKESALIEKMKTIIMNYVVKIIDWMNMPIFIKTESAGGPRESGQSAQQTSTPVGIGQSFFSKSWAYFSKNKEREEEKEEKEEKEVSQIQSDVPAPLTPESFKYHILIGQGAFGKVFVASHPAVDQLLAIKIAHIPALPPKTVFVERYAMEATEDSRFFPRLYATFHTEVFLCYVMEFVNGGILQEFIDKRKPMDINIIRFIAAELLCALQFLHARGIAHCDLHSSNILVDATGHVKIIDFGLASINKIVPCQNDQSSTFTKVVQRIFEDYYTDYLSFKVLLEDMARRCPDDITKLHDLICKISTFSKTTCSNLRDHPFFTGINWDELEAGRISPPYSMKPIPAINRSLEIGVNKVFYYFKCVFLSTRTFSSIQSDQEFDFVSDRWRDMQQHH